MQQAAEFAMEAWVPDWRLTRHFESISHQETVEYCLGELRLEKHHSSFSLSITPSGYHYLGIAGIWMMAPSLLHKASANVVLTAEEDTGIQSLKILFRECNNHWPRPEHTTDRIWLPLVEAREQAWHQPTPLPALPLAFILRAGHTRSSFLDKPVYRLHSCFLTHLPDDERLQHLLKAPTELKIPWLFSSAGLLFDQEFCLE